MSDKPAKDDTTAAKPASPATSHASPTTAGASSRTTDPARDDKPGLKEQAAEQAKSAQRAAKSEAEGAMDAARSQAERHVDRARSGVAEGVEETAENIRDAGRSFEPGSLASSAADRIADNLAEAASAVRGADLGTLSEDLSEFARRNPLVFFGGAALLGFMAGRMMKASERAEFSTSGAVRPATPVSDPRRAPAQQTWGQS